MVKRGQGNLVAVSSMAGHRALPGRAAYSASKAAVTTFMDGLRMDLHGTGVHAMTICPGFVKTPLTSVLPTKLPFLVELDDAIAQMSRAIDARADTFTFPWQMRALVPVFRHAPEALVRRLAPAARTRGAE
jgi:short-subunit dehydrogenase